MKGARDALRRNVVFFVVTMASVASVAVCQYAPFVGPRHEAEVEKANEISSFGKSDGGGENLGDKIGPQQMRVEPDLNDEKEKDPGSPSFVHYWTFYDPLSWAREPPAAEVTSKQPSNPDEEGAEDEATKKEDATDAAAAAAAVSKTSKNAVETAPSSAEENDDDRKARKTLLVGYKDLSPNDASIVTSRRYEVRRVEVPKEFVFVLPGTSNGKLHANMTVSRAWAGGEHASVGPRDERRVASRQSYHRGSSSADASSSSSSSTRYRQQHQQSHYYDSQRGSASSSNRYYYGHGNEVDPNRQGAAIRWGRGNRNDYYSPAPSTKSSGYGAPWTTPTPRRTAYQDARRTGYYYTPSHETWQATRPPSRQTGFTSIWTAPPDYGYWPSTTEETKGPPPTPPTPWIGPTPTTTTTSTTTRTTTTRRPITWTTRPTWPPTTEETKGPPSMSSTPWTWPTPRPTTTTRPTTRPTWPTTTEETKGPPPIPPHITAGHWVRTTPDPRHDERGDVDPRRGDMPPEDISWMNSLDRRGDRGYIRQMDQSPTTTTLVPPELPPPTVMSVKEERRRLEAERERHYRDELHSQQMSVRQEHEMRRLREEHSRLAQRDATSSTPETQTTTATSTTTGMESSTARVTHDDDSSFAAAEVQRVRHYNSERRRLRQEQRRRISEMRRLRQEQRQVEHIEDVQRTRISTNSHGGNQDDQAEVDGVIDGPGYIRVSAKDVSDLIQSGNLNVSATRSVGGRMERARLIRNMLRNQLRPSSSAVSENNRRPVAVAAASNVSRTGIPEHRESEAVNEIAGSSSSASEPADPVAAAGARRSDPEEGDLRLVGGRNEKEGNVEIYHLDRWGSVCDDEWDEREAQVVCRHLGFTGEARPTTQSQYGKTGVRVWMDNLFCDGSERTLGECRFDGWSIHNCMPTEAAGVMCDAERTTTTTSSPAATASQSRKNHIRDFSSGRLEVRLANGRINTEGRVEVRHGNGNWSLICGDGWGLLQASVVCRQLGFGYAADASQTDYFGGDRANLGLSGVECRGNEATLDDCLHGEYGKVFCPGDRDNIATVNCAEELADLLPDPLEVQKTAHLEDRQLWYLQCALEENCLASRAYQIQKTNEAGWHLETRRLLRFTAKIVNQGTAEFRPFLPKQAWQWHQCHLHYHSMEVFAHFDILEPRTGRKIAQGHKASFCLEDNDCRAGAEPVFNCENFGDQGISVGCADIYAYNVDCQWIDVSEVEPGFYTFKVSINPDFRVGEQSFENNAAVCNLTLTETYAQVTNCHLTRP